MRPPCQIYYFGSVPYTVAWNWQHSLIEDRKLNPALDDVLMLLEHPPVYTLGQGADLQFLKFDPLKSPVELHRVERGGEVTYHCPGQLVGYPILNLKRHTPDLHWYLRQLEEVLIQVLRFYELPGERIPGLTGVWIGEVKVAAVGIKVSRWITMHGFALNVCPDMQGFEAIVPCGIAHRPVGSLAQFIPGITIEKIRPQIAKTFAQIFEVELIPPQVELIPTGII
ncbi:Octanoyltransferase [Planktothrix tepida]|uniref:Octanoyltransferase n=1 Tax=Planktothrix tepida PCC 9214 TaxID=671072 RepID=A0A1J1LNH5_9CYAN|nr:lipoyl(octanoyl) transferase LipB [Planktothrix tepida]CAD5957322.1 Octanoyltransferase [Planktothrix tepida]CUR34051.1 Octanoyltransferase [Planktothrix tepida PCC 9214]